MKRIALIAAVVLTTLSLESCRQPDEVLSPAEAATLQKVQDSTSNILESKNGYTTNSAQQSNDTEAIVEDGEILPPPRK